MNIPGPRPDAEPVHRGEFEPRIVYLKGDTVTSDGATWRCLDDFRSGYLPPEIVAADRPGEYWERVL